jgi:hypothetical protein
MYIGIFMFKRQHNWKQTPFLTPRDLRPKPANGKTTLVKSIAGSTKAPIAYWQITEFTNSSSIEEIFSADFRMAPKGAC